MKLQKLYDWGGPAKFKPRLFLESAIIPSEVTELIKLAQQNTIRLIMVGANAANVYTGKPRNTADTDFICDKPKKLHELMVDKFPHLVIDDHEAVIRVYKDGDQIIDVIKPYAPFINDVIARSTTYKGFVIPTLEAMLALKYAAMVSPNRDAADKKQDAVDFMRMVKRNPSLDSDDVALIVKSIYEGAGLEVRKFIKATLNGESLNI